MLTSYRDAFVFVVLILMLLFRPNGLLGRREREERPPRLINRAFVKLKMLEVALGNPLRWPWGSTLFAVGRKQHQ